MEEKQLFCRESVICEDGQVGYLRYYLFREREEYGILVEMRRGKNLETAAVSRITPSREKLISLLYLLSQNTVTPCALQEILWEIGNNL